MEVNQEESLTKHRHAMRAWLSYNKISILRYVFLFNLAATALGCMYVPGFEKPIPRCIK